MKYILLALLVCCAVTVRASEVEIMLAGADQAASAAASMLMTVERAQAKFAEQSLVEMGDGGRVGELNEIYETTKARVAAAQSSQMQDGDAKVHGDQKDAADTSGGAAVASAGERGGSMIALESNEMQGFVKDSETRAERDLLRSERQNAEDVRMVEEQSDAHLREGIQAAEQKELDITAAIKRKEEEDEKQLRAKEEETIKAMVAKEEEMEKKLREAMYNMGKARLEGEQASEEHLKDEISKVVEERQALAELEKQSTSDIHTTAVTVNTELQQKLDLAQIERQKLLTEERNAREAEALLVRQQRASALNAAMTKEAMLARRRAELAIQREAQVIALRADKQRARAASEQAFAPMGLFKTDAHHAHHAALRPAVYGQ